MYKLPKIFCPTHKTELVRVGKSNDGGYIIPKKSIEKTKILYSFGIYDDWSFEENFKKKSNPKIVCFDNSIGLFFWVKKFIKELIFFSFKKNIFCQIKSLISFFHYKFFFNKVNILHVKKHIISKNIKLIENNEEKFINLENILKKWGAENFFLKIDIGGAEYSLLDEIIFHQDKMTGLVMEFHNCDIMKDKITNFINKINLDLVHIHVNNFCDITNDDFPTVLELTFSPKNYNQMRKSSEFNFPLKGIDQPNNKDIEDKSISFF